ncbi:hypothetical protein TSO5_27725 [Azospirillum sp. TSO5]|nr:hypothetical protein TSO5_27725 [Azospirillum sp. TSO5]
MAIGLLVCGGGLPLREPTTQFRYPGHDAAGGRDIGAGDQIGRQADGAVIVDAELADAVAAD